MTPCICPNKEDTILKRLTLYHTSFKTYAYDSTKKT